jgi:hypothetical protein
MKKSGDIVSDGRQGARLLSMTTATCLVCDLPTLSARGGYEICPTCGWEDDDGHPCGPNGGISLEQAKAGYEATGSSHGLMALNRLVEAVDEYIDRTSHRVLPETWMNLVIARLAVEKGNGKLAKYTLQKAGILVPATDTEGRDG